MLSRYLTRTGFRPFSSCRVLFESGSAVTESVVDTLIGREQVQLKKKQYEQKYEAALRKKAEEKGVSLDDLKKEFRNVSVDQPLKVPSRPRLVPAGTSAEGTTGAADAKAMSPKSSPKKTSKGPVKSLDEILDLEKVRDLPAKELGQIWSVYNQAKGHLSAAVPKDIYLNMFEHGKKYPLFILPLSRNVPEDQAEKSEMFLLQWSILPLESQSSVQASSVIFTPLAEYKARQEFSQPYLILTHYTDLADSHDIVLLRGEITPDVALNEIDAQALAVMLQLFYNSKGVSDSRTKLLKSFHEKPAEFDLAQLMKLSLDL